MTRKKVCFLILIGFVFILNSVNAQDLVAYWTLDEGFGDTAYDTSGYSNDGTLYGSLNPQGWTTDCMSESCLKFNGVDDHVRINNFGDFSNGFTIIFWFNMSRSVYTQRPFTSSFFTTCYITSGSTDMNCFLGDGTSWSNSLGSGVWSYGTWTHFAMTYDTATGDWIIYRNGNPVGTDSYSQIMDMTNYFCIGANCWTGNSEDNFNGTIDEVKIYNRSLSSSEVMEDYIGSGTTSSSTTSTTTTPLGQVTVSGQLSNSSGVVEALVTLFNPGTSQVNKSESTVNGVYSMNIWPGIYDLQYNIYHIPNFFIKLLSLTITSNLQDILDNFNILSNGISFEVDITKDEEILVYSDKEPLSVKVNGIELTKETTLPIPGEWTYSTGEIRMIVDYDEATATTTTSTTTTSTTTTTSSTLTTESTTTIFIPPEADYIITGSPPNYEAIRVSDGQTISSGSNAASVINDVLNEMASGQRVDFIGDFTITSTIIVNKDNLYLDFSQATVALTASVIMFRVNAGSNNNTFYGGQYDPFTNTGTHSVWTGTSGSAAIRTDATNTVVDGFEFTGFTTAGIYASDGSVALTVQNCYFHDMGQATHINLLRTSRDHNIINCKFDIDWTGIMINGGCWNNKVLGCEFLGWKTGGGHAIYTDGGANTGYNEIANCLFHDGINGAGCHIKSQHNDVHDNTFRDLPLTSTVAISLYSELPGYIANDNDIYDNTFTNCHFGIWLGHDTPNNNPTLRNKVYNNVFTNVTEVFHLLGSSNTLEDTKIYYNDFHSCASPFPSTVLRGTNPSFIKNTVIAYNYFDANVPNANVLWLQSCDNSMSYQNTFFPPDPSLAMANFNINGITDPASPYYISPR